MSRILIAEDESRICAFIEKGLRTNGFATAVAKNGKEAISMANSRDFDLLILDIGLPVKDGWQVLEELRGRGEYLPIVIFSARDDVTDKVAGLEGGADDYMTKPFRFEELLARVRLRVRHRSMPNVDDGMVLQARNIVLDLRKHEAKMGDRVVELSIKEFTLIEAFIRNRDRVLSREQLLNYVWGYDYDPGSNIVDVYVGYLRKKLGNDAIETVRGIGYRLRA